MVDDEDFDVSILRDYSKMKVIELKKLCRVRGLAMEGRKQDIIEHLHCKNFECDNFICLLFLDIPVEYFLI